MINGNSIFIFGSTGYIGNYITSSFSRENIEYATFGRSSKNNFFLDLNKPDFHSLNVVKKGDKFIFLAGIASPSKCSDNVSKANLINLENTRKVIRFLINRGVEVLFASSDVIYGETDFLVTERSMAKPKGIYAEMKYEVEKAFIQDKNFYSMRLSYVWAINNNFSKLLYRASDHNEIVSIYHPLVRSIVSINDVITFVKSFCVEKKIFPKIVNLAGPDFLSRKDLIKEFNKFRRVRYKLEKPSNAFYRLRPAKILMTSIFLEDILKRQRYNIIDEIKSSLTIVKNG